jgi:hypothetical protein
MLDYSIKLIQGEIRDVAFLVNLNKRPMDISGHTCQWIVKKHPQDGDAAFVKYGDEFNMTYAAQGLVSVEVDHGDIGVLATGTYEGQLKITDADGKVRKTMIFAVEILPALDIVHLFSTSILGASATSTPEVTIS